MISGCGSMGGNLLRPLTLWDASEWLTDLKCRWRLTVRTSDLLSRLMGFSRGQFQLFIYKGLRGYDNWFYIGWRSNVAGQTFAVFRVDKNHHLLSFVSKMIPSPDWVVGVSKENLCLANCTWAENRVIDLYPWDLGIERWMKAALFSEHILEKGHIWKN